MKKQSTKTKTNSNVFNFFDGCRLPQPEPHKEKVSERISFEMKKNVFGLAEGDKIICETVFDLHKLSRSALVVAKHESGSDLMPLAATSSQRSR